MSRPSRLAALMLKAWPQPARDRHAESMCALLVDLGRRKNLLQRLAMYAEFGWQGLRARIQPGPRTRIVIPDRGKSMERLVQDTRYALQNLARQPGYTAAVVLTMGLGIGANVAVFTLVNDVLLRPLPIPAADRVVQIFEVNAERGGGGSNVSFPNATDLADRSEAIDALGLLTPVNRNVAYSEFPERVRGALVDGDFFDILGMEPVRGRVIGTSDQPGDAVVLVSESYWRSRLGADPGVVGRTLRIDGSPWLVVGVVRDAPALGPFDLYQPLPRDEAVLSRRNHFLTAVARLAPDVTLAEAGRSAARVGQQLQTALPDSNAGWSFRLMDLKSAITQDGVDVLGFFVVVVGAILIIACANVTNLMLVRANGRTREIAVRGALGATRGRVVRQLLTESVLLAVAGGLLGVAIAYFATGTLRTVFGADLVGITDPTIDGRVLLFALALSSATGLFAGSVPAWKASGQDVQSALRETSVGTIGGAKSGKLRAGLVIAEVTVAVALLTVAGRMTTGIMSAMADDPGFDPTNVTTMRIQPPAAAYPGPTLPGLADGILDRVRALPGVEYAAITSRIPLGRSNTMRSFKRAEDPDPASFDDTLFATWISTTADYFETQRIELATGRGFRDSDAASSEPVIIINETMARSLFETTDAVGRQVHIFGDEPMPRTVVGVIRNVRSGNVFDPAPRAEYFTPFAQAPHSRMSIVVRSASASTEVVDPVRAVLAEIDSDLPVFDVRTMHGVLADETATPRLISRLVGTFAALALGLALVGLYGVVAYSVACRTHEIGIRLALGARQGSVRRHVVASGMRLATAGALLGMILAAVVARVVDSRIGALFSTDALTIPSIALIVVFTTLLASYLPARRATRIDPLAALRVD